MRYRPSPGRRHRRPNAGCPTTSSNNPTLSSNQRPGHQLAIGKLHRLFGQVTGPWRARLRPLHLGALRRSQTALSPLRVERGLKVAARGMSEVREAQTHSTSEWMSEGPPGLGRGVRGSRCGTDRRRPEAPTAASAAAASSSLTSAKASTTRSSASPTSVSVTARRRRSVLDRQRQ